MDELRAAFERLDGDDLELLRMVACEGLTGIRPEMTPWLGSQASSTPGGGALRAEWRWPPTTRTGEAAGEGRSRAGRTPPEVGAAYREETGTVLSPPSTRS